jgi:hypothetical protein
MALALWTDVSKYFKLSSSETSQLIDQPTRLTNTLDLVLTNRPGKVLRTETIPGISDHDIVYTEFDFRPVKLKIFLDVPVDPRLTIFVLGMFLWYVLLR